MNPPNRRPLHKPCRSLLSLLCFAIAVVSLLLLPACGPADARASDADAPSPFVGRWTLVSQRPDKPSITVDLKADGTGVYRAHAEASSIHVNLPVTWKSRSDDTITVHKQVGPQASSIAMLTLEMRTRFELVWTDAAAADSASNRRFLKK